MPKSSTDLNSLDTSIVNDNDEDENSFKIVFETGGDDSESEEEEQEYPEESEVSDDITMLQTLSKCEVKAWLCWNLIILPSLRFYMKSNFGEFKLSNNAIFGNFRASEFWFLVNLSNFQVPNLPKFKVLSL